MNNSKEYDSATQELSDYMQTLPVGDSQRNTLYAHIANLVCIARYDMLRLAQSICFGTGEDKHGGS